jgi:hypothetical protein
MAAAKQLSSGASMLCATTKTGKSCEPLIAGEACPVLGAGHRCFRGSDIVMERQRVTRVLPKGIGNFSKAIDAVLLSRYIRDLYNKLKQREAYILV